MKVKHTKTERGFAVVEFEDYYGKNCSIQKSSLATKECIWFGVTTVEPIIMASQTKEGGTGWVKYPIPDNVQLNGRMHLTTAQVKKLIPILQRFVESGEVTK